MTTRTHRHWGTVLMFGTENNAFSLLSRGFDKG